MSPACITLWFLFCCATTQIQAQAAAFLWPLDHTQLDTHTHTHPVVPLWTCYRPVLQVPTFTRHNKHRGRTSMASVGFQPAISAIKTPQTYALDRTATGVRLITFYNSLLLSWVKFSFFPRVKFLVQSLWHYKCHLVAVKCVRLFHPFWRVFLSCHTVKWTRRWRQCWTGSTPN